MKRATCSLAALVVVTGLSCAEPILEPRQPVPTPTPPSEPQAKATQPKGARPPETPKKRVTDALHGVQIADDYRWLENGGDAQVKEWTSAQNAFARTYFDAVPDRAALEKRVNELLTSQSPDRFALSHRGGVLFALKDEPPKQQPFLVVMKSADEPATERVLVDPNVIDPSGKTSIDFYVPTHDGKKVAVSMSKGGTEDGTVSVYDVATGKATDDVVPRVNGGTAGGSVAWTKDGKGFYRTRYPHTGERPAEDLNFFQQVHFHELGKPAKDDRYAVGKEFPRIAEVELESSEDGKWFLASVANGDGGEYAFWLLGPSGKWERFADHADKVVHAEFGPDGKLYLLSLAGAPHGKILRVSPAKPALAGAETVVPESKAVIQSYEATKSKLFVIDLVGGPNQIRVFDTKGKQLGEVPIPPVSSARQLVRLEGDEVLVRLQSFVEPPAWYRYKAGDAKATRTGLFQTSKADFRDIEVARETCTSKDGTKVPLNVLRPKGVRADGSAPTLLVGYGGYSISLTPGFNAIRRLWLDQGGVLAIANLRGGGEFGEEWHDAGKLTKKQNVFDDFYGCAKHLVDSKVTRPDRLAILGGSNGGLLMGAAVTQHPEMYRAVVALVGIHDMVRVELTPNGAFNVTEFGTVKDAEQFKALYAYSPFHRVKDGTAYPAVLLTSGANDPRVDPYHSRKMAARLQAATSSGKPVLLRASGDTGHGGGNSLTDEIRENVDIYGFLFRELGVRFSPGAAAGAGAQPASAP